MASTETRSENTMRSTTCSRPSQRWTRPRRPWRRSTRPWPRSNSSIAFRLVDTRLTPGNHYLFLMWGVSFTGNGRCVFLLLDLINGLDQGQVHWPHPDWSLRDWHLVKFIYFCCRVSCFWEIGGVLSITGYDQRTWPRSSSLTASRLVDEIDTWWSLFILDVGCLLT